MTDARTGHTTPLPSTSAAPESRRWLALACISVAQLMVALDATVINIALPSAQHALGISDPQRQWVVTAYTLAFGGLLILGGRVADTIGRRRAFLAGLAGFALASLAGGAAPDFAALVAARAVQGACAALLAPTALSLLAVTFTAPRERAKAFAVFGAIAGMGGALGLLLGGVLTEYLQWRWCLYINVPIAIGALVASVRLLPAIPVQRHGRFDLPGVVLVVAGLVAVVYGLSSAGSRGWSAPLTATTLAAGVALLVVFLLTESRTPAPLLPMLILADRNRGGAYAAIGLAVVALYGLFLLLTYDFQVVLHYSPVRAGLAFLPMSAAVLASSTTVSQALLPKVPPRMLMTPGLLLGAAGMATLTLLQPGASYPLHVLPAELLLGLGMGAVFVPAFSTATLGVGQRDAGVASAVAGTSQQIGASVGTALLNTLAAAATTGYVAAHGGAVTAAALVHGYAVAAGWAAVILAGAAVLVGVLVTA
ncbi:MAG: MFS transporter, partial [Actinobacteria bacterium]|nr:MFS transporter [Actinomycetota bacterium]